MKLAVPNLKTLDYKQLGIDHGEKLAIAISFESRRSESDRGLIRQALQREGREFTKRI